MPAILHNAFPEAPAILLFALPFRLAVQVSVRLMGPYKRAAGGVGDIELSIDEPSLRGVLQALAARFPEAARKLHPAPDTLEPSARVVLNDVVLQGPGVHTVVKDGDRVAFVPIVGGGFVDGLVFHPTAKDVLKETYAKAKLPAEIEVYAAAHGWCPPDSAVYDEKLAEKAWSRLLVLFKTALA